MFEIVQIEQNGEFHVKALTKKYRISLRSLAKKSYIKSNPEKGDGWYTITREGKHFIRFSGMVKMDSVISPGSGSAVIGSGYSDIARVDRDQLIKLLYEVGEGPIDISSVPHVEGRAVIIRPAKVKAVDTWFVLAPVVLERPKTDEHEK
jgi:predicted transcriptional regulator